MKFILTLLLSMFVISVNAKVIKPVIDNDLSHRYDNEFEETQRSVAGDKPESVDQVNEDQEWDENSDDESSRNPSAAGETFQKENDNGIRYWKY